MRRPAVDLVHWMCTEIRSPDLLHGDKAAFLNAMVRQLLPCHAYTTKRL